MKLEPYYKEYHNVLSEEFCKHCIEKFKKSNVKSPGRTGNGLDTNVKDSTDLTISNESDWQEEDKVFLDVLSPTLSEFNPNKQFNDQHIIFDTGYQIQETTPSQKGYIWHNDFKIIPHEYGYAHRIFTYIFYLNDVSQDGETQLFNGVKIKPERGKLLLFLADHNHWHRGIPPTSNTKYICTGWVYKVDPFDMTWN